MESAESLSLVVDRVQSCCQCGLLVGLASWGEYFGALILTGPRTETAPVAVSSFIGTLFNNWSELAAAGVVVVVPALVATIAVQRGFVRGLTFGAVKQ
jgi:multiple sugar transport system permease protein